MFNAQKIAELQARVSELEGLNETATSELTTVKADLEKARTDLGIAQAALQTEKEAHTTALNTLKDQHAEALTQAKTDFEAKVQSEATHRLAEIGIPEAKLPKAPPPGSSQEATLEDTIADMQAETDPRKKGVLAAKVAALRAKAAKGVGQN